MNVAKEKWDTLVAAAAAHEREAARLRAKQDDLEARAVAGDRILEKIVRVAQGQPVLQTRGDERYFHGAMQAGYSEGHSCTKPTTEEVQRVQIGQLQDRVVLLEARLASVVAVASFAQEHKL